MPGLAIPTSPFFQLLSVLFRRPLTFLILVGMEGFNGAPSANEPAKDLILVHTVQLKPIIKANSSGRTVSRGISDLVITSVYSEKTCLKKLIVMKMIIIIIIIMNKL